jgi:hypothetical protein
MKSDIRVFFENISRKFIFNFNLTRIVGTLHENHCTIFIISLSVLLKMRNISEKIVEKVAKHFMLNNVFENRDVREIMWKNMVKPNRPQMKI